MKRFNPIKQLTTYLLIGLSGVMLIGFCSPAYARWSAAIGTGFSQTQKKGDLGVGTASFGPVMEDVDLSPGDFNDLTSSSFVVDMAVTDGTWMVDFSVDLRELRQSSPKLLPDGATVRSGMAFDTTATEITVGRVVYRHPRVSLGVHGGLRYDRHELSVSLRQGLTTEQKDLDEKWVDVLIGGSADVPFGDKWLWSNKFNGGFGGSEGTWFVASGVTWRFHKNWSTELYGNYTAVNYESGSRGDTDWYLYEVDEAVWGANILFRW